MKFFIWIFLFNNFLLQDNNNEQYFFTMEIKGNESEAMRLFKIKNQGFLPQSKIKITNSFSSLNNNNIEINNNTNNNSNNNFQKVFLKHKPNIQKFLNPI